MNYQEFLPAAALRAYIHRYGIFRMPDALPAPLRERLLPMPAQCWVFPYACSRPLYVEEGATSTALPAAFLARQRGRGGAWVHEGGFCLFFVWFKPGFECQLEDTDTLHKRIRAANSATERAALADVYFQNRLSPPLSIVGLMQETLLRIHADPAAKLAEMSRALFVSPRHLRRVFQEQMGLPMKQYQQIVRICRCMQHLNDPQRQKIADVAYHWGFYDQTHFYHAFKNYTGLTPRKYLQGVWPLTSSLYWREG